VAAASVSTGDISFSSRLTAEAVRYLEQDGEPLPGSEQVERAMAGTGGNVEQRIIERARQLAPDAGVGEGLQRIQRYARLLGSGALVLSFLLGGFAAAQAFDQGKSIVNFYWLLLVLLGFNFVSLVFWLFSFWASGAASAGVLGQSGAFLLQRWIGKTSPPGSSQIQLTRAWLGTVLQGPTGRWTLSSLSHGLWTCYLLGGLLMIMLLLAARQYDFVWETTLLGPDTFVPLTEALAWLPAKLGLPTPSLEQINQSRLGADPQMLADARQAWASLLIASLLLYGILPRLLLLVLSRMLRSRALKQFTLDTSRPYYVRLRQRLVPPATTVGVVDADDEKPQLAPVGAASGHHQPIPGNACWLGIELGPEQDWPPIPLASGKDLGCVSDRAGQQQARQQVVQVAKLPLVLVVPMHRSPDRGMARFIGELLAAHPRDCWLALLENAITANSPASERDARLVDWYALAARSNIEADRITQLQVETHATAGGN
jgi:hypothetical protein